MSARDVRSSGGPRLAVREPFASLVGCKDNVGAASLDDPAAWDWPLPPEPYLPGRTSRPSDDDDVHRLARAAPRPTASDRWRSNPAYVAGLRLYANGYYWEAHEAWEPVWMAAGHNTQERRLVQGVIQLSNAGLKLRMGRPTAAARLSAICAGHLREATYGPARVVMGIDAPALLEAVEHFVTGLSSQRASLPALPLVGD